MMWAVFIACLLLSFPFKMKYNLLGNYKLAEYGYFTTTDTGFLSVGLAMAKKRWGS